MTAPVEGVLLDVDDTLVDTRGAFEHAIRVTAVPLLRAGVAAGEAAQFWRADRHGFYRSHTRGEITHFDQRKLRAADMHAEYGGPEFSDAEYVEWEAAFEQSFKDGWRAHDDAVALLDALDGAGVPYGALTNAARGYQETKLAAVGLERVRVLVGVDTLGYGKPDPRVFHAAVEALGTARPRTAYVGDEFDIDAAAASAAGLVGVWCERAGLRAPVPDADIRAAGVDRVTSLTSVASFLS